MKKVKKYKSHNQYIKNLNEQFSLELGDYELSKQKTKKLNKDLLYLLTKNNYYLDSSKSSL